MIKSTRVPFQARFILRLYVGVDTLHRAFFITKYIRQNHLALEHLEFTWVRLQRGVLSVCPLGSSPPRAGRPQPVPAVRGARGSSLSPSPGASTHVGVAR